MVPVLAACLMCLVLWAGTPAVGEEQSGVQAGGDTSFPEAELPEPVQAGQKKRRGKQKRNRRNKHGKNKPHKAEKKKPKKKKKHTKKGTPDGPKDKMGHDTPAKDKPAHEKPPRDPKNKPDRNRDRKRLVCIGGRVRAGRCLCRRAHTRNQVRNSVVACRPSGAPAALPHLAQGGQGEPDGPAAAPAPPPPPAAVQQPPPAQFAPDEVLVALSPDRDEGDDDAIARDQGLEVLERLPLALLGARLVRYRIPDGRAVADVVAALETDARALSVQPNFFYRQDAGETEPGGENLQYALNKVEIGNAHLQVRGRGTLVAIIDSTLR